MKQARKPKRGARKASTISAVTYEVVRSRLLAITEEMRIALQSVSGSPTVTEASDFFTGLFLPDGSFASMGLQVSFQASVVGHLIRAIKARPHLKVHDGDMFCGNDPFVGALHQNDVQLTGPIFVDGEIIAWAGVECHVTDIGGMDFASWSPKARDARQEGLRIPCVKLVEEGALREDILEMILTATRLPAQLGLDFRAFIATINVARQRMGELVRRYGAVTVVEVMHRMIAASEQRMRARLAELPDGDFHATDFLEHDGHTNTLYRLDLHLTKRGDKLVFDFSGSSPQAPGFINCTRSGLVGAVTGSLLPMLAYDIPWNEGILRTVEIVAPDGLICTAKYPAPVGAATVEAIWVVSNAVSLALNRLLACSDSYRHRVQAVSDGTMATFNLGGINQYGEPFGLHLMDPLAGGYAAFASKDGYDGGGPNNCPVPCIADVERNEQAVPLFYFYRRLARDTGGAGAYRGGLSAEVALTLGGVEAADALIMTHGAEVPNTAGIFGGYPGATVIQRWGEQAAKDGILRDGVEYTTFGPKPGLIRMKRGDVFAVSWQGGGGFGDPLERDPAAVLADLRRGAISAAVAIEVYGVVIVRDHVDQAATEHRRQAMRRARVGTLCDDPARFSQGKRLASLGDRLFVVRDPRGLHVVSPAGFILATGSTRWRAGAVAVPMTPPAALPIVLHERLAMTGYCCPATGALLSLDIHEKGAAPADDMVLDLAALANAAKREFETLAGSETMTTESSIALDALRPADSPPPDYDRPATYERMISEKDVAVPMRDGVKLSVDVYRPDSPERFPALLAFAIYNKDFQGPDMAEALPPQPAWAPLWTGPMEAGDTRFFVSRGYVHVIGMPRGVGKSEGGGSRAFDSYDLIEWIAAQPWCDGNVGMVGISGFGAEQLHVAKQQPPHLKAIFPFDPRGAYGVLGGFREEYPGGVIHLFRYLVGHFSAMHQNKGAPGPLPPEREVLWREAMSNPDYQMYPHVYNLLAQKGQHMPPYFDLLIDPFDKESAVEQSEAEFARIKVPTYTGSGWYGYTYKTHLNGAQSYFANITAPKKLTFTGPAHLERPFHSFHHEILRWHDHWLKGIDTGMMREPPVKYWVMGENAWRTAADWPLPETQWTKLYLNSWERLSPLPFTPSSVDDTLPPDVFVQMPPTQTSTVQRLRYVSEPLAQDLLVAGPIVLNLFASIDQDDTNWIVILKDIGPDVSVRTAREGERELPKDLPERELTRGWLKASHRALDPKRSKPWKPWHPLTRAAAKPVIPGEVTEYAIEILATANLFRRDHRIALEITCLDLPTGVAGATNAEYVPYHICSSRTTLHRIFHDARRPSHLLLPVIPTASNA